MRQHVNNQKQAILLFSRVAMKSIIRQPHPSSIGRVMRSAPFVEIVGEGGGRRKGKGAVKVGHEGHGAGKRQGCDKHVIQ